MIPLALMLLLHLIAGSTICLLWKFCYCYILDHFEKTIRIRSASECYWVWIHIRSYHFRIHSMFIVYISSVFSYSWPILLAQSRFIKRILYNQALFKVIYAVGSIQKQMHTHFQKKKNVPLNAPISNQTQNYHYMLLLCRIVHFRLICNNNILWSLYKSFPIVISSETVDEHRHFHFVNGVWLGTVLARFIVLHITIKW